MMTRRHLGRGLIVGGVLAAIGWFLVAGTLADAEAADHARLHAAMVAVLLLVAGAIRARWPSAGLASWAPTVGLLLFATGQAFEAIGAIGYDATGRQMLAELHDVGLMVTPLGLVATVIGITISLALWPGRRAGAARWVGIAAAIVVLVGGLAFVKTMIGV